MLALTSDSLKLYSYEDENPIVTISFDQLVALHTVTYDDERTPHLDAIDNNAQALQVTLKYQQHEYTCLFRRMLKVRPVDWYHELQKARWPLV